jgi:hypothetical protein
MRIAFLAFAATATALAAAIPLSAERTDAAAQLKSPGAFSDISDKSERAVAIFNEAAKVITHPRCMNCHPATNRPLQGDDSHPHQPLVVRGMDGFGAVGMRCTTCHGEANFDPAGVPGNPKWHLAPPEMAWVGKSVGEICKQIKDTERNGGMSMAELIHHMAEDELVGWGWEPGAGRTPAPGTQKEFGALIKAWADNGAACPAS